MPYTSPGGAFSSAFESFMANQAAQQHQALGDRLAQERENRLATFQQQEMANAQDALKRQRDEADSRIEEKSKSSFEKRVHDMMPGDVPDAGLLALDDKYGTGYFAPDAASGHRTYQGTRQDREAAQQRARVQKVRDTLQAATPGTPEYQKALIDYGMETGKPLTAAEVGGAQGPAPKSDVPVVRTDPGRQVVQRLVDGKWVDLQGDAPAGSHFLQEPTPKDTSAATDRATKHVDDVRQQAYQELDKWSQPILGTIDGLNKMGIALNQKTPQADTLIAPLVLKATVSGQGSGFRMTRAEIDNVLHGRSKWDDLQVALNKWDPTSGAALQLTDSQRDELRSLARAIRDKATKVSRLITDARHAITDAGDTKTINHHRDTVHDSLMAMDDDGAGDAGPSNGLPSVGSMFNGGKVLKITPVK